MATEPHLELRLNGEPKTVALGATLLDLLQELGRDPRTVAVELNGEIVRRARFAEASLRAGDRVELVHFVQGG
jgi:thiamine biosynthesis protein ThiS